MLISLNWLKKYIDLQEKPEIISQVLTSLGFEVEKIHQFGANLQNVYSAEVRTCGPHPEADKLSLCQVYDGSEELQIVCGAPNVRAGQKVLLAKIGAILPGDFKIKKSKIRGIESFGMICAEDELGLGDSHEGILVLPESIPVGLPLTEIPGLLDCQFEVSITPNRPDGLCHIGIARELAAYFKIPLNTPTLSAHTRGNSQSTGKLGDFVVSVESPEDCSLYTARMIHNLKVGPSPEWLKKALKSIGLKSINNLVDITNYVLMEWGQPSHVFDLDKIQGNQLIIRKGKSGEECTTLDNTQIKCTPQDLIIADQNGPVCIAGVMGGLSTGVSDTTVNVLLEVAYFKPETIRVQAKRMGLSSDSSYRFERGIDPFQVEWISDYITQLIQEVAGGKSSPTRIDLKSTAHPTKKIEIPLRTSQVHRILGIHPTSKEIESLLSGISILKTGESTEYTTYQIPGFRPDLTREIDLIEEVARLSNYNNIPTLLPALELVKNQLPPLEKVSRKLRYHLSSIGLQECISLRFSNPDFLKQLGWSAEELQDKCIPLKNPISEEWRVSPISLSAQLLQAILHNQNRGEKECRFFEVGKIFHNHPSVRSSKNPGVIEIPTLSVVLWGPWTTASWQEKTKVSFYHLKGICEDVLHLFQIKVEYTAGCQHPLFHPNESLTIHYAGQEIGRLGTIHPRTLKNIGLKDQCYLMELNLSPLTESPDIKFSSFSKQVPVEREMNILVDTSLTHQQLESSFPLHLIKNMKSIRLNSVYQGEGVPAGKKALHYTFTYQHAERSLTDEEVNKWQERFAEKLLENPAITYK